MRKIPEKLKREILADPYYKICARKNQDCDGRITWEHPLIYGSRQINEKWSIIPICAYHHSVDFHQDGPGLNKEINVWIALNRATNEELLKYSKVIPYIRERNRLNKIYGFPCSRIGEMLICYCGKCKQSSYPLPVDFGDMIDYVKAN